MGGKELICIVKTLAASLLWNALAHKWKVRKLKIKVGIRSHKNQARPNNKEGCGGVQASLLLLMGILNVYQQAVSLRSKNLVQTN